MGICPDYRFVLMVDLICRYCGERYAGEPGTVCCPRCAAITPSTIRKRICRECGKEFAGGPNARYCPECRAQRQKEQSRNHKERKRNGQTRPIGSVDFCIVCGKEYTVESGNQRYCPECAVDAVRALDNAKGRIYGKTHNAERQERRKAAKADIICAVCGKAFVPKGKEYTCGAECAKALDRERNAKWEAEHAEERKAYHREKLREKVAAMSPEEYAEYREKENAKARENYRKRKERK